NGNGALPHSYGNGNGKHAHGVAYANGAAAQVNGHAVPVNGNGNGNGSGLSRSALNLTSYPAVFDRNGNGTNGSYTRLAVLDVPGDLPVALPWLGAGEANPTSMYLRFGKRAMDMVIASAGLLLLSPLFLLLALLIKIDSRGPVFYKSKRLGRNG